ncbi:MAG: hypothetical protein V7603_1309 [Micromonosporaceae bacterium]
MLHGLVVTLVLLALVCLPCVIALLITADAVLHPVGLRWRRMRLRWAERRLASRAGLARGLTRVLVPERVTPVGPPIEKLAADLRRLSQQRTGVATRSTVWFNAVSAAYDNRLAVACQELEIQEHLDEVTGLDLEIERLRVEGMLLAAGLRLDGGGAQRHQGQQGQY